MRVLIGIHDEATRCGVVDAFRAAFYQIDEAADGCDAAFLAATEPFDAIVLDCRLPGIDCLTALRQLREDGLKTPVVLLAQRPTRRDRVDALRAGADDYLGMPLEPDELLARVEVLIRRAHGLAHPVIRLPEIEIDLARKTIAHNARCVRLTAMEFRTMAYLGLRAGQVVSQAELIGHVYDDSAELSSNVIEVIVSRIRRKLHGRVIQTVRGHGYMAPTVPADLREGGCRDGAERDLPSAIPPRSRPPQRRQHG